MLDLGGRACVLLESAPFERVEHREAGLRVEDDGRVWFLEM